MANKIRWPFGKDAPFEAPSADFGNSTGYTSFETDGTIKFNGTATVFDDSMVPPTVFRVGGTSLTFAEITDGIYGHRFDVTDEIHFQVQFGHGIKRGANIGPHIHILNKDAIVGAANVTFTFKYRWADISSPMGALGTDANVVVAMPDAAALTHKVGSFTAITPTATQSGISSILIGSLTRVNTGYATANIFLLGFDIHYEKDTIGSREEFVK